MAVDDFFAPGRIYSNQEGQIVVPSGAEILLHGGVAALDNTGNGQFPQKIIPTLLRWPFDAVTSDITVIVEFNFYVMDAWLVKVNDGGVGDVVSVRLPQNQGGDQLFTPQNWDVNVVDGTVVPIGSRTIDFRNIGQTALDVPQEIRFASTNVTDCSCDFYLMVGPYLEAPSPRA